MKRMAVRVFGLIGLLACLHGSGGCGSSGAPTGSVSGRVTYRGEPLTVAFVLFVNDDTGSGASAELDSSGTYRISSIRTGHYKVAFGAPSGPSPWELEGMVPGTRVPIAMLPIPSAFLAPETSGLAATVERGGNTADFDL
jgi:hypothetical protein